MNAVPDAGAIFLDPQRCDEALRRKDTRFDGRFFFGVKTTGICCRPVCPAPAPKALNCTYWRGAARGGSGVALGLTHVFPTPGLRSHARLGSG